jgi:GNAT superfamily N-acetyltransferase
MDTTILTTFEPQRTDELIRMWRASFEHGVGILDPHPIAEQRQYFVDEILPKFNLRVAMKNGEIVGFVASDGDSIGALYIGVPEIGHGIGTSLLNWAKDRSNGKLWLFTFARNLNARRFYEKSGFEVIARGHEPIWGLDDIKYEWSASKGAA